MISLASVGKVIAVASGKGGVGKSTISVNLACALRQKRFRVGLLDLDLYGPSLPHMMNLMGVQCELIEKDKMIKPVKSYGIECMSMGLLTNSPKSSVLWRGLMVSRAVEQLLFQVAWGDLDWLVIDLPPGTGDVQITLAQQLKLDGALIVSTPQQVAISDAQKAADLFTKLSVPVLGVIENMGDFCCPTCHSCTPIFRPEKVEGGIDQFCKSLNVPLLGSIPLDPRMVTGGDAGKPIVLSQSSHPIAEEFRGITDKVVDSLLKQENKSGLV